MNKTAEKPRKVEEYAIILDILPRGRSKLPIAQVIGTNYFTLLEVTLKDSNIPYFEKVYIGKDKRDVVDSILKKIRYEDLTPMAKLNIKDALKKIVLEKEEDFVKFINEAQPISPYVHSLELLPRIGKKWAQKIIEEREKEPYKSFEDIKKRISRIPDLSESIAERIANEIMGNVKVRIFVK
jgi:putative nucleotide binding protein